MKRIKVLPFGTGARPGIVAQPTPYTGAIVYSRLIDPTGPRQAYIVDCGTLDGLRLAIEGIDTITPEPKP